MDRITQWVLIALAALGCLAAAQTQPQRIHIPLRNPQDKAEFRLRKEFPEAFAATAPEDEARYAEQLRRAASDSSTDPVRQYVLLRDAREMSVAAGDFEGAFAAIDQMGAVFQINPEDDKVTALGEGVDMSGLSPPRLVVAYLRITNHILDQHDPPLAQKAFLLATDISRRLRDQAISQQVDQTGQRLTAAVRELNQARVALRQLKTRPEDANANLVLGRYLCGSCGQWDEGLPYLAKGSDAATAAAATLDLASPTDGAAMIQLGDTWADVLPSPKGVPAAALQERAAYWYRQALKQPNLNASDTAKAQRRLAATQPGDS